MPLPRRPFRRALLVLASCLTISVAAQTPPSQLSGHVVRNDTGAPIANATVRLEIPGPNEGAAPTYESAVTDRDGKYNFAKVLDGKTVIKTYTIRVTAEGFLDVELRSDLYPPTVVRPIDPANPVRDMDFRLVVKEAPQDSN